MLAAAEKDMFYSLLGTAKFWDNVQDTINKLKETRFGSQKPRGKFRMFEVLNRENMVEFQWDTDPKKKTFKAKNMTTFKISKEIMNMSRKIIQNRKEIDQQENREIENRKEKEQQEKREIQAQAKMDTILAQLKTLMDCTAKP